MKNISINRVEIGQKIRKVREAKGLTQEQLAKKSGFRTGTLSDWERGGVDQRVEGLAALAIALGVTVAELMQE